MLQQFGGEGKNKYKGNKSDMNLVQHGGEGKMMGGGKMDIAFTPKKTEDPNYCGPGRYLKSTKG